MKTRIVTADIHLVDDPNEEFRWKIFQTLREESLKSLPDEFVIVGDLTDAKNNHSDTLVNRIKDEIAELSDFAPVKILLGNHDYEADPSKAFFKFLGKMNNVTFIDEITEEEDTLWLPHTRDTAQWRDLDFTKYKYIFTHQCYIGATANNGYGLSVGTSPTIFGKTDAVIIAGDIHAPQRVGKVQYVGAPARFRFGDKYTPRILRMNGTRLHFTNVDVPLKHKITVDSPDDLATLGAGPDDIVRIELRINKDNAEEWKEAREAVRKRAAELGINVESIQMKKSVDTAQAGIVEDAEEMSQEDVVRTYGKRNELSDDAISAGLALMEV